MFSRNANHPDFHRYAGLVHEAGAQGMIDHPALGHLFELLESTISPIVVCDQQDRVQFGNSAFRKAFFVGMDETPTWADIMRRNHAQGRGVMLDVPDIEAWLSSTWSRRGKTPVRCFESNFYGGRWLWVVETVLPNGWMLVIGSDVTHLSASKRQLRSDRDAALRAAQVDELTGVSNRRHIMDQLSQLVAGQDAHRHGDGCVCLLDLDEFKQVNDVHGHQAGDAVLTGFTRIVRNEVRLVDCFGRMGGEEFLLIMPGASIADATAMINRLLGQIGNRPLSSDHPDLRVTFSAGLTRILLADTVEAIYSRCDRALFKAKDSGRNGLCIAEGGTELDSPRPPNPSDN